MSDRVCVDEGYNRCFTLGQEGAQNMIRVVPGYEKQFFVRVLA